MAQWARTWGIGSVTEQAPGEWRLTIDGPRGPVTGRRRQYTKTVRAKNRTEAQRALGELASDLRRKGTGTTDRTLRETCEAWAEHAKPSLSPNTARELTGSLERYVYPSPLAARPLAKVKAVDLDTLYRGLQEHGGKVGGPLKPATVRKVHTALSLVFAQAVRWERLARNPAADASSPKAYGGELEPPSAAQVRRLIAAAAEAEDGPLWAAYLL